MELKVKRLVPNVKLPVKAGPNEAGIDLFSTHDATFRTGYVNKILTGIALEIPEGYFGLIRDRSSMAAKGFIVSGGVIDSSYRGEIIVCMTYLDSNVYWSEHDDELMKIHECSIKAGDKIAQLLILPVPQISIIEVDNLSVSDRGNNGFGSTGV